MDFKWCLLLLIFPCQTLLEIEKPEDPWESKCHRTQLDDYIYEYKVYNNSFLYLPTLKKLKKLYPGDKFVLSKAELATVPQYFFESFKKVRMNDLAQDFVAPLLFEWNNNKFIKVPNCNIPQTPMTNSD